MAVLRIVGPPPSVDDDIERKQEADALIQSGISRGYVDGRVVTLAAPKATKTYVDTQDELYQLNSYYITQDSLNVLINGSGGTGGKGQPLGVASLDSSGKIPAAQVPVLGTGIVKGPYGPSTVQDGTTSTTPVQVAQWVIGTNPFNFRPMVFLSALCTASSNGRPVVEIRIGDNTQTTYASQTLVAQGFGRAYYNDYNAVTIIPAAHILSEMQDGVQDYYSSTFNTRLTAWLYSANSGTVSMASGHIAAASAYLLRVTA